MSALLVSQIGLWIVTLCTLVLVLVLYRHFGLIAMASAEGHDNDGVRIGESAPPLHLQGLGWDSAPREIMFHRAWTVLFFGTTVCEPCVEAMERLNALVPELRRRGVRLVVALQAQDFEDVQAFAAEKTYLFDLDVDIDGVAGAAWEVKVTPFAFIIGPDSRVRSKAIVGGGERLEGLISSLGELLKTESDQDLDSERWAAPIGVNDPPTTVREARKS